MTSVTPCLWYDGAAEAAARFYVSLLPDSRVDFVSAPMVGFTLAGRPYLALDGGPHFKFTEAVSLSIAAEGQAEVDRLWEALIADGGAPSRCGWLKDRWGLSWQVVPTALPGLMGHPDPAAAARVRQALMAMGKIDIAALERAGRGEV